MCCRAHKGNECKDLLNSFSQLFYLPPYTSSLNAIETYWSVLKMKLRKEFTRVQLELKASRERCMQICRDELEKVDPQVLANLQRAHYKDIHQLLMQATAEWEEVNGPLEPRSNAPGEDKDSDATVRSLVD